MKVLVACEESQTVCKSFRKRGHEAYSCDIQECSGGHPEWHIQDDVLKIINEDWDLIIAHPSCTHIAVSGARYFKDKRKTGVQQEAVKFFMKFTDLKCSKIVIENPVCIMSTLWKRPSQIIQPWMFGENASKRTCLWLKGVPKLEATNIIPPKDYNIVKFADECPPCKLCGEPYCLECNNHYSDCECMGPTQDDVNYKRIDGFLFGTYTNKKPVWANQTPSGQNKLGPSPTRAKLRSKTYKGIADAMANQWG